MFRELFINKEIAALKTSIATGAIFGEPARVLIEPSTAQVWACRAQIEGRPALCEAGPVEENKGHERFFVRNAGSNIWVDYDELPERIQAILYRRFGGT
jgi:hypothetical protein